MKRDPEIRIEKNGPLIVINVDKIQYSKGEPVEAESTCALCRCGSSKNKPFCDGSHIPVGFKPEKESQNIEHKVKSYRGEQITVHFNLGVCSHSAVCLKQLPNVFDTRKRPWINVDEASVEEIIETIEKCPSGALTYTVQGKSTNQKREAKIVIDEQGPYNIEGGIKIQDECESKPYHPERYAMCRCGKTLNTPFCDGSHWKGKV